MSKSKPQSDNFSQLRSILDDFDRNDYSRSLVQRSLVPGGRKSFTVNQQESDRIWTEIDRAIVLYELCCIQCPTSFDLVRAGNDIPRVVFNLGISRPERNLYDELEEAGKRAFKEIGKQDKSGGFPPLYPHNDAYMQGYMG